MPRYTIHPAAVLAIAVAAALAQNANEAVVISPAFVVEGRVVKGVPYSAQAVTSVKQTLPTGSEISTQVTALVARDTEGRTRREQNISAIGPWALGRESPTVIVIQDPVKMVNYTLDPRTHLARMTRQRTAAEAEAVTRAAERERKTEEPRPRPSGWEMNRQTSESLGNRTIERVPAEGKRTVTLFPAGSIGNSAPLELVLETWFSPELQVVVLGKRSDPRVGDMTYRLVNIKRGEPPASLFEVPSEYRIEGEPNRRPLNEREPRKEN